MADAGVAEGQHDGAAVDGQVLVAVPLARGGLDREQLEALPVGHDDVLGLAAARVLRRQQPAHGALAAAHDVEPADDPAVALSEAAHARTPGTPLAEAIRGAGVAPHAPQPDPR